jgi:hypothetical protein
VGNLRTGVQKLKDATPNGVLLGSGKLATELDRLDLIDEYKLLVPPGSPATVRPCTRTDCSASKARFDLGEAATQRHGRHALSTRNLTRRWIKLPNNALRADGLRIAQSTGECGHYTPAVVMADGPLPCR